MSPLPSVASEVFGSTKAPAEPSKNRVQISFPLPSSLRRPIGSGALESEMRAIVSPAASVAIATKQPAAVPLPTGESQPEAGGLFTLQSSAAPISRSELTEISQVVAVPLQAPLHAKNVELFAGV